MHEAIVLLPGHVTPIGPDTAHVAGTVTLLAGQPNVLIDTGDVTQRMDLVDALTARGLTPADSTWVVNTHGHLDHVGNNNLFPDATFILGEDIARRGEYRTHDFGAGPFAIECGDGGPSLQVISVPGHTDHDLAVLVETADGVVAVAGDLFEYEGDRDDDAWREWTTDEGLQRNSRERLLAMADFIVPGHGGMFAVVPPGITIPIATPSRQ